MVTTSLVSSPHAPLAILSAFQKNANKSQQQHSSSNVQAVQPLRIYCTDPKGSISTLDSKRMKKEEEKEKEKGKGKRKGGDRRDQEDS